MNISPHGNVRRPGARALIGVVFLGTITIAVFATWFTAPISGDATIFFAAAKQADYQGNFPLNVHRSWELKPLGHRIAIYSIYKAATGISEFRDKVSFERAVKIIYGAILILTASGLLFSMRHFLRENGFSPLIVFLIGILILFSTSYLITFQPEEMSLVVIMVALPLALAKTRGLNILSGLVLASLFTLKGITLILGLEVLVILYALGQEYRRNLCWCMGGLAGGFAIVFLLLVLVFSGELRDLRNATLIQGSLEFDPKRFLSLPWAFWHKFQFAPVLMPAAILAWLSLPVLVWRRQWGNLAFLFCIMAISGSIVLMQGLFFGYHYAVFVVPSTLLLFSFAIKVRGLHEDLTGRRLIYMTAWAFGLLGLLAVSVLLDRSTADPVPLNVIGFNLIALVIGITILCGWLFLCFSLKNKSAVPIGSMLIPILILFAGVFWARYQSPWTEFPARADIVDAQRQVFGAVEQRYHLSRQDKLLYLSPNGAYAYHFGAPTHCRYFTTLPLTRIHSKVAAKGLRQSSIFRETLDCVLSYEGQFVLEEPGWPTESFPDVAEKLASDYERVEERHSSPAIVLYQKRGTDSDADDLK